MVNREPWQDLAVSLPERVLGLCEEFASRFPDHAGRTTASIGRLEGPLRLALAGRVKAGKSTLLNALVGERLAPTDAGECTKIVTWYVHGPTREATAHLHDGASIHLPFTVDHGRLDVDLLGYRDDQISRLEVSWPSQHLAHMTLIDTPGLQAMDKEAEQRTRNLFADHSDEQSSIDAVLYLMRHVHHSDTRFLEAFLDRSVPHTTPVNALAVLSRADELGAGGYDSMQIAKRIANRYAADERLTALVSDILPVSGLLAETSATFTEREASALRELAGIESDILAELLLSVDRLRGDGQDSGEERLLDRLGLFGVRDMVRRIRDGDDASAPAMARSLAATSGITELRDHVKGRFGERAGFLKAKAVLQTLHRIRRDLEAVDAEAALWLRRNLELFEAAAVELELIRALHLLRIGAAELSTEDARELSRLVRDGSVEERLSAISTADTDLETEVIRRIGHWQRARAVPTNNHAQLEVCDTMVHAYEAVLASRYSE